MGINLRPIEDKSRDTGHDVYYEFDALDIFNGYLLFSY